MAVTLRAFYPIAPDRMHVNAWALAPKEEVPAMRERRRASAIFERAVSATRFCRAEGLQFDATWCR
jgi:hypothetical protein